MSLMHLVGAGTVRLPQVWMLDGAVKTLMRWQCPCRILKDHKRLLVLAR